MAIAKSKVEAHPSKESVYYLEAKMQSKPSSLFPNPVGGSRKNTTLGTSVLSPSSNRFIRCLHTQQQVLVHAFDMKHNPIGMSPCPQETHLFRFAKSFSACRTEAGTKPVGALIMSAQLLAEANGKKLVRSNVGASQWWRVKLRESRSSWSVIFRQTFATLIDTSYPTRATINK